MKKVSILSALLLFFIQEIKPIDYKKMTFAAAVLGLTYLFITSKKNQNNSNLVAQKSSQPTEKVSHSSAPKPSQVIPNDVTIYKVLQQHDSAHANLWTSDFWKEIYDQAEGTNCGYHALKNALSALQKKPSLKQDIASPAYYQEMALPWIREIQTLNQQRNSAYPLGNMLIGSDIEHLIKKFMPHQEQNITVIDNFETFDDITKFSNKELAVLKKLSEEDTVDHAFIVNTDALQKSSLNAGFHWVVYFLKKSQDGQISIIYMDSLTTINPMIAKKIKRLCLSKKELEEKLTAFQEVTYVTPILAKIEMLKNKIVDQDYYLYQKHVIANVSLGLVEFKDLHLADNLSLEIQKKIKQVFEENFPQAITTLRKSRNVIIDGTVHKKLTQLRQSEIEEQFPKKLRLFTLWKQNKNNGNWHIQIDTIADNAQADSFLLRYQQKLGTKPSNSRDVILQDINTNAAITIEQIFNLIESIQQHPWSLNTSKSIISICKIITDQGICNGQLDRYRQKTNVFLRNIQETIRAMPQANSHVYEIYEILKNWNDVKNTITTEICKDIEQLQPE